VKLITLKTITVICAIIIKDNKILVTQRSSKMILPLKWEFPGGKLELGENEIECIIREIKEELNIEIEVLRKLTSNLHFYESFAINLIPYIANYESGEIYLTEHAAYKFLDKKDLLSLEWADADLPIVNELLNLKV
jgi:8-oxo-dGTP diphosphatase